MATSQDEVTGWVGWVGFAGVLMIMLGIFQAIVGLAAVIEDDYWVEGVRDGHMLVLDVSQWGWIHLILGGLVIIAGFSALAGKFFGRMVGVLLALGVALANLTYLRITPVWSVIAITLSVLIIYALMAHGREAQA